METLLYAPQKQASFPHHDPDRFGSPPQVPACFSVSTGEENHLPGAAPGCDSLFKELLAKGAAHGGHILLASTHQEVICHTEGSPSLLGFGFKQMGWCLATLWQIEMVSQGRDSGSGEGI